MSTPVRTTAPMESVNVIRAHQKSLLARTREHAALDGAHFALTSSDELEEILHLLGIPSIVYNYWNFVILSRGKGAHYRELLEERGYPGPHFFALGYASMLDPEQAPWGGLPEPTIMIGSARNETELRVTEIWARDVGARYFPLDFNMASAAKQAMPEDWFTRMRDEWPALIDPDRLALRDAQNRMLIARLEELTGRTLSFDAVEQMMLRVNRQMDVWMEANDAIATAENCPVSFRDQTSMYQAMWYRGTAFGLERAEAYRDEVLARIAADTSAYSPGSRRLLYWTMSQEPLSHHYLQERGAAIVGSPYSTGPRLYARELHGDPLRALAGRNLFLFDLNRSSHWLMSEVERLRADGVILVEDPDAPPSPDRQALEKAGIPVLLLPVLDDSERAHAAIDRFLDGR